MSPRFADPTTPDGCRAGLDTLLAATQKARSNLREAMPNEQVLAQLHPLLFGTPNNLLTALIDATTNPPQDPFALQMEFMNLLAACEREPAIGMAALNVGGVPLTSLKDAHELVARGRGLAA